jgi:antitoxin (DNA-binding transcriptional repressor) of toxin-antitoxin stability system
MGIPVARLGPHPRSAPAGLEALDLAELATFARIDAELLVQLGDSIEGGRT